MNTNRTERGSINALLIPVILLSFLFVGTAVFGYWAFTGRQDYKTNVDQKITVAVAANKVVVQAADAKQYAEAAKLPLRTYVGPEAYGTLHISYPKTWSAYVNTASGSSNPLDGYFYPDVVPSVTDQNSAFALRIQVVAQSYDSILTQFNGYLQQKTLTVTPYALPQVPDTIGVRLEGQLTATKKGSMIILPVRDKTLKIWTEVPDFEGDFNNNILPNATFSP